MDNFKSSDDVLAAINDLANGIPEGGGEEQERYSFPEVLPDPVEQYLDDDGRQEVDRLESDANLREQWKADETARMQHEYAMTGEVPQFRTYDEWRTHREIVEPRQNLQKALAEDVEDIALKYNKTGDLLLRKLRRGEVDLDNANLLIDNTLEDALIGSLTENEIRQLSTEQLREIIDGAKNPLRTKSLDIAEPRRKKPVAPQKPRQKTYKMPEFTQQDIHDMMSDFINKHPERFRR